MILKNHKTELCRISCIKLVHTKYQGDGGKEALSGLNWTERGLYLFLNYGN
jgi:hypothetical protein